MTADPWMWFAIFWFVVATFNGILAIMWRRLAREMWRTHFKTEPPSWRDK